MHGDCCRHPTQKPFKEVHQKPAATTYTCPMHPEIKQPTSGFCPVCGMDLEPITPHAASLNTEYHDMVRRCWGAALLSAPILILSMGNFQIPHSAWIQWIASTPVVFLAGSLFFRRAWQSLLNLSFNMFTLIALGIGSAYFYSVAAVLVPDYLPASFKLEGHPFVYFEASAVITTLALLGQVLELKAKEQTNHSIQALLNQTPPYAHLVRNGIDSDVRLVEVRPDDILRVKPGEKIPADGIIIKGTSSIDESMLTGESVPIEKKTADNVNAGTLNLSGSFLMKATHTGEGTLIARIIQMVSDAQRSKAPIQQLADAVSAFFVPTVILIACTTFMIWATIGPDPRLIYALANSIAVLMIACPCALGLATPMSITVGIGKGAEHGILIRNGESLETLEKVDTILLDKTGTLTEGKPAVVGLMVSADMQKNDLLRIVASLEVSSEHPLALAIVKASKEEGLSLSSITDFASIPGEGISGIIEGRRVLVGSQKLLEENGSTGIDALLPFAKESHAQAQTVIFASIDGKATGSIAIADPIKRTTDSAISTLHKLGLKVIMVTGDHNAVAEAVAKKLGIDEVHAEVGPLEKITILQRIKSGKRIVAMVGDGVNDALALAEADVGIAMGTGTDAAMESAGVTLVKGDLTDIARAIELSRSTMANIRQNLFFAFFYNVLGIPIAAGVLFPIFGWLLNPMVASAAMACSSVSVILNALRLKRTKMG